jgi:hypothetical protein
MSGCTHNVWCLALCENNSQRVALFYLKGLKPRQLKLELQRCSKMLGVLMNKVGITLKNIGTGREIHAPTVC